MKQKVNKLIRRSYLFLVTLKYLTLKQIANRSFKLLKKQFWKITQKKAPFPKRSYLSKFTPLYFPSSGITLNSSCIQNDIQEIEMAENVINNTFVFLNHQVYFKDSVNWHDQQLSQLWRFNLHYFLEFVQ